MCDKDRAEVDGLTSLTVLAGTWLSYPMADLLISLLVGIALVILKIVWDSGRAVFAWIQDGVDPAANAVIHVAPSAGHSKVITVFFESGRPHRDHARIYAEQSEVL